MTIKVFQLNDYEWWAGESLADCIAAAREELGKGSYCDAEDEGVQVSNESMRKLTVHLDEDRQGEPVTFEARLASMVADGEKFPQLFASTEF